jgi:hypothetical protein
LTEEFPFDRDDFLAALGICMSGRGWTVGVPGRGEAELLNVVATLVSTAVTPLKFGGAAGAVRSLLPSNDDSARRMTERFEPFGALCDLLAVQLRKGAWALQLHTVDNEVEAAKIAADVRLAGEFAPQLRRVVRGVYGRSGLGPTIRMHYWFFDPASMSRVREQLEEQDLTLIERDMRGRLQLDLEARVVALSPVIEPDESPFFADVVSLATHNHRRRRPASEAIDAPRVELDWNDDEGTTGP